MTVPVPACRGGYTEDQLVTILGEKLSGFQRWMRGQTMMLCQQDPQREWVDDPEAPGGMRLIEVGPSLCDTAHGPVVYAYDLKRFLAGKPVID